MSRSIDLLEAEADRLLAGSAGIYTEVQLKRRERDRQPLLIQHYAITYHVTDLEYLNQECWRAILSCADRQHVDYRTMRYLRKLANGQSYREIAKAFGVDHHTISAAIDKASEQIRRDPYHDLYEVIAELFRLPEDLVREYCRRLLRG